MPTWKYTDFPVLLPQAAKDVNVWTSAVRRDQIAELRAVVTEEYPLARLVKLLDAIDDIYADAPTGCCMHVVLDDNNIEDDSVRFCLDWARKAGCERCARFATAYLDVPESIRAAIQGLARCGCGREYRGVDEAKCFLCEQGR